MFIKKTFLHPVHPFIWKTILTISYSQSWTNQNCSPPSIPLIPFDLTELSLFLTPLWIIFFSTSMGISLSSCFNLFLSLHNAYKAAWNAYLRQNSFFFSIFLSVINCWILAQLLVYASSRILLERCFEICEE